MYITSRTNALRKLITHWPGRQVDGRQMLLCRVSRYSSEQGVSMSTRRDYYSGGKGAQSGAETTPCLALHHSVSGLHLLLVAGPGRDAVLGTLTHFAIPWPQDGVPSTELCMCLGFCLCRLPQHYPTDLGLHSLWFRSECHLTFVPVSSGPVADFCPAILSCKQFPRQKRPSRLLWPRAAISEGIHRPAQGLLNPTSLSLREEDHDDCYVPTL